MPKFVFAFLIFILPALSQGQTASFTYQSTNGLYCSPSTINFTQTCTGSPIGFTWSFGNGQFSNDANPSIVYSTAGTYTVKLVAIFGTEAIETSQTIVINPSITSSLTVDRNYICLPGMVAFTLSSTGSIVSYDWNFGDGATTSNTSPTISHTYAGFGAFSASVKATDAAGCFSTSFITITVQNPPIAGSVSPISGCIPANVNFIANVTVPIGGSVTNYTWNFGDGSPLSNIGTHTYNVVGSYNPSVSITTNEGCTNTFNYQTIAFGTPPTNHIAYPRKLIYCGSETAVFISKANTANTYFWDYGDGITETITDTITQHKYLTLGPKTVTATPYFNGCAGTPISFQINIVGVIACFTYSNTCTNKKTFSFTNTSLGNQSAVLWNFGDGSPTASTTNVTHTFPNAGTFNTTLTITDNLTGCTDATSATIFTASPSLINPDTFLCRNNNTTFTIQNNTSNAGASYNWNVVGLTQASNNSNPYNTIASVFGNFSNNYVVINNGSQYCGDTITLNHPIAVRGPNLSFTAPTPICANTNYTIINTSNAYLAADTVKRWYWNYGITNTNDTIYQPPTIRYTGAGTYTIKLFAHDKNGCIDSLIKSVVVKPIPFLRIFPRNDTLCQGQLDTLIAFHSDTLLWSPAALVSCTTCDTVIANPNITTLFYATATNSLNCTVTDSTLLTVYTPFIASAIASPVYVCLYDSVRINAVPIGKTITWSPTTDISNSTIYNPLVFPPINTTYTALLADSAGCFNSSTTVDVIVKSLPQVNAGPDRVLPYNSPFTLSPIYSSNVISYEWSPAEALNCSTCQTPSGTALDAITYNIKVTSDSGCVAKDDISIFVECKYANLLLPSAFSPNRDRINDVYAPITRGIKSITKFAVFNRYGQLMYDAKNFIPNDKNVGWDGRRNGIDQTPGAYMFVMEAICDLGEIIQKQGSFLLLR